MLLESSLFFWTRFEAVHPKYRLPLGEVLEDQLRAHAHRLELGTLVPTWRKLLSDQFDDYAVSTRVLGRRTAPLPPFPYS